MTNDALKALDKIQSDVEELKKTPYTPDEMADYIPASAVGEKCSMCGKPAARKVCENIFDDDPRPIRLELTAYVCLGHFNQIMNRGGYLSATLAPVDVEAIDLEDEVKKALRGPHEGTDAERAAFEKAFRGLHGNSCLAELMEDGDYRTVYASRSWRMWKRACRWAYLAARGFGVPEWNDNMDAAPKDGTRILGYRFHEGHHKDEAESFHVVWWQKDCFDYEGFMDYEQRRWNIRAWQPLKHAKKAAPKKEGV